MFKQHIVDTPEPHLYMFRLTFDQLPVVQSAGQGMCVLQEERDSGLGMCSQSLGCRASRSSALTAWVQSTVLLVRPKLPQLAEHLCHSPTHHLHTHTHTDTKREHFYNLNGTIVEGKGQYISEFNCIALKHTTSMLGFLERQKTLLNKWGKSKSRCICAFGFKSTSVNIHKKIRSQLYDVCICIVICTPYRVSPVTV